MENAELTDKQNQNNQPLAEWQYILTEEEIYEGLKNSTSRKAGPARNWVQTILLVLVAAFCLIAFFAEGMKTWESLFLGIIALVLIGVLWVVPEKKMRFDARKTAEQRNTVTVRFFDEGLAFGKDSTDIYTFTKLMRVKLENMIIFQLPGFQMILLPRRIMSEEEWQTICKKCS